MVSVLSDSLAVEHNIRKLLMAFIINIHRNEPGNTSHSIYISKVGPVLIMIIFLFLIILSQEENLPPSTFCYVA